MSALDIVLDNLEARTYLVQSPYLAIMAAGSTGADNTTAGVHLRWTLAGQLGENHLPKGERGQAGPGFNRPDDHVHIFRSRIGQTFATVLDLANMAPSAVLDHRRLWIHRQTNTGAVIHVSFEDADRYDRARNRADPREEPDRFLAAYGDGVIAVKLKDRLAFRAMIAPDGLSAMTKVKIEGLSVSENRIGSPRYVSLRSTLDLANFIPGARRDQELAANLIADPLFFRDDTFTSDLHRVQAEDPDIGEAGVYALTPDVRIMNATWRAAPVGLSSRMVVRTSGRDNQTIWETNLEVEPERQYLFTGKILTIDPEGHPEFDLEIRADNGDAPPVIQPLIAQADIGEAATFQAAWTAQNGGRLTLRIIDRNVDNKPLGVAFADFLFLPYFKSGQTTITAENLEGIRFRASGCLTRRIFLHCYDHYIDGVRRATSDALPPSQAWQPMGRFSLVSDTNQAMARFNGPRNDVGGRWPKFDPDSPVSEDTYRRRWERNGGIRDAVLSYLALSARNDTPRGERPLHEDGNPQDILTVAGLDLLNVAATDFHIARMLGLGTLDPVPAAAPDAEYVYLAVYCTEAPLDHPTLRGGARAAHMTMSVPTRTRDDRLPDAPVLDDPVFGIIVSNGSPGGRNILRADGTTWDGLKRYVNFALVDTDPAPSPPGRFFEPDTPFSSIDKTPAAFLGLKHRLATEARWRRPEPSHALDQLDGGNPQKPETMPISLPELPGDIALTHEQTESGRHLYACYGINLFSRPGPPGPLVTIPTTLGRSNDLLPPHNLAACLIQPEAPLLLTTAAEQARLTALPGPDRTLVRVTFDYTHIHDLSYPDGRFVEFLFREQRPKTIGGKVILAQTYPHDPSLWEVRTGDFTPESTRDPGAPPQPPSASPALTEVEKPRFTGGSLVIAGRPYGIQAVLPPAGEGTGPTFLLPKLRSGTPGDAPTGTYQASETLESTFDTGENRHFVAVENMADAGNWRDAAPLANRVTIGDPSWRPWVERFIDASGRPVEQTLRGFLGQARITSRPNDAAEEGGIYELSFQDLTLSPHPQADSPLAVEWYQGVVRIAPRDAPNGPKKVLEVIRITNVGNGARLQLTVVDPTFSVSPIPEDAIVGVNFYPGYRLYLPADDANGFNAEALLPEGDDTRRTTYLGARSADPERSFRSPVSAPAAIIAQGLIEPEQPTVSQTQTFATRPDNEGRSSYSFTIRSIHRPFALAVYRTNDSRILHALYQPATVARIREDLAALAAAEGGDTFLPERWSSLLSLSYPDGRFPRYPEDGGYRFPNPDKAGVFNPAEGPGEGDNFTVLQELLPRLFTPLTEQPLLYRHIRPLPYQPRPGRQVVRDENGKVLEPTNPAFDQAPMARLVGNNGVMFTDFTLDGASRSLWFYAAREIGSRMKMGPLSPVIGPVFPVNTAPAPAPAIKGLTPRGAQPALGLGPSVSLAVSTLPAFHGVTRYLLMRTTDADAALSVRAMTVVDDVTPSDPAEGQEAGSLTLSDHFTDLPLPPYGVPVFYRVVGLRPVVHANDANEVLTDWAPSLPSRTVLTNLIDTVIPDAPRLSAEIPDPAADLLEDLVLRCAPTATNADYRLFKRNARGNWEQVALHENVPGTEPDITFRIAGPLPRRDANGPLRHHFKVEVQNSSGLISTRDRILTL
ncbi:hypothetical protein [Rhodospirillum sp. A1_3_36]|uniref:hypothetical protein n=1 Tax=Rhodospirillum sp. A1_3_36 TaxID=3391666 RepID=UPI0039A4F7BA